MFKNQKTSQNQISMSREKKWSRKCKCTGSSHGYPGRLLHIRPSSAPGSDHEAKYSLPNYPCRPRRHESESSAPHSASGSKWGLSPPANLGSWFHVFGPGQWLSLRGCPRRPMLGLDSSSSAPGSGSRTEVAPAGQSWVLIPHLRPRAVALAQRLPPPANLGSWFHIFGPGQ